MDDVSDLKLVIILPRINDAPTDNHMRLIPNHIAKAIPALALIALASVITLSFLLTANNANAFDTASHNVPPQPNPQFTAQCSNGIAVFDPANNPGLVADCAILLAARDTIIGDNGDADALDWSEDIGIHRWLGVRVGRLDVNSPYRVIELGLWHEELAGTVHPGLGNLSNLRELYILETQLTGVIPPELGNLAILETLEIEDNRLTGVIPPELGNLANLRELAINDELTGAIPPELGNLASLETLDINAEITGSIPTRLGTLANLEGLSLSYNQLTGTIPPELGNLAKLERLYLQGNQLTGIIPPELGNLANLSRLELGENQLTGCIPDSLRDLFDYADLADLGLPFCDAAPVPPAPTPPTLPTATSTSVSGATASPTSQPTRTRSPTATSESGGDADVQNRLSALEALVAALKAMIAALEGRMAALEASPAASAPTATRTATPTSVANAAAPTPTATFVAGVAPTATATPDACVGKIGVGWITGAWHSGCVSDRRPIDASAPAGTRYARFYTFTLDAPADITVTLTSQTVSNTYLYLLSGAGRNGEALHENNDIDAENGNYASRIAARLPVGSYTIEATAYNLNAPGNFTLSMDLAATP